MKALLLQITPSDRSVLQLLAEGKATPEIASGLGMSESAVETQLSTLLNRMGAATRSDAVAAAIRRGLIAEIGAVSMSAT